MRVSELAFVLISNQSPEVKGWLISDRNSKEDELERKVTSQYSPPVHRFALLEHFGVEDFDSRLIGSCHI